MPPSVATGLGRITANNSVERSQKRLETTISGREVG